MTILLLGLIVLLLCTPQKDRWKEVVIVAALFVAWKVARFAIALAAYCIPIITQHWGIALTVGVLLTYVPFLYFGGRSDFRENQAIRAGCQECFNAKVQYLIRELKYSQEKAVSVAQRIKDEKGPPRWMVVLLGERTRVHSLYHVLHRH
jgi:hypothetical protein